jgi:hypothetical protein
MTRLTSSERVSRTETPPRAGESGTVELTTSAAVPARLRAIAVGLMFWVPGNSLVPETK